jgi:hypothetical protein
MNTRQLVLRITLGVIALVQLILGMVFILLPAPFAALNGLATAPAWVHWLLAMFGARALGFAYGMVLALRDPQRHSSWIRAMIGVQAIDWIATIYFVLDGAVTLAQVSTAAFLPVLFIAILTIGYPRRQIEAPQVPARRPA